MKDWRIDYSVKMINGEINEELTTVHARTINDAFARADAVCKGILRNDPAVSEVVIWGVCIIVDDEDDPEEVF